MLACTAHRCASRFATSCGRSHPNGTSAEIALATADLWQRRGIATELMTTLERIAVATGIARLTGECLTVANATWVTWSMRVKRSSMAGDKP